MSLLVSNGATPRPLSAMKIAGPRQGDKIMKTVGIAFFGALLASGAVAAKDVPHARPALNERQFYGLHQNPSGATTPGRNDFSDFDHSGTEGREGFGASPFNPEGPGNVVD
jgi:hypothetical protein